MINHDTIATNALDVMLGGVQQGGGTPEDLAHITQIVCASVAMMIAPDRAEEMSDLMSARAKAFTANLSLASIAHAGCA